MEHTPRNEEERMNWTLLGTWGVFEYWLSRNVMAVDGAPMGARWDSTLTHFQIHVAGRLAV